MAVCWWLFSQFNCNILLQPRHIKWKKTFLNFLLFAPDADRSLGTVYNISPDRKFDSMDICVKQSLLLLSISTSDMMTKETTSVAAYQICLPCLVFDCKYSSLHQSLSDGLLTTHNVYFILSAYFGCFINTISVFCMVNNQPSPKAKQ